MCSQHLRLGQVPGLPIHHGYVSCELSRLSAQLPLCECLAAAVIHPHSRWQQPVRRSNVRAVQNDLLMQELVSMWLHGACTLLVLQGPEALRSWTGLVKRMQQPESRAAYLLRDKSHAHAPALQLHSGC